MNCGSRMLFPSSYLREHPRYYEEPVDEEEAARESELDFLDFLAGAPDGR